MSGNEQQAHTLPHIHRTGHRPLLVSSVMPQPQPQVQFQHPDWVEYVSGGGAAVVNIAATFPLNKLIFRQQLLNIRLRVAVKQLKHEGMRTLYRGVLPPLCQRTLTLSMMFGLYDQYTRIVLQHFPDCPLTAAQMLAAILSGTSEAIMVPFERVQTLLQDNRQRRYYYNSVQAFKRLSVYGVSEFYRGLTPILLRNGPSNAVFFAFRGHFKKVLPEATSKSHEVVNNFISGAVLGAVISTVWFPLNVVKSRMQIKTGGNFESTWGTFKLIYEERGRKWRKMFRGVQLNFSRALISWGIINASYEFFKSHLNKLKEDGRKGY
ncbi:mitochondrial nicotinamide adenine dinucleotide transporter SLC25A51-like [Amphiura filiformis]|uniref:mitochondrial nicotinamide adenine dinucleotide transporter SLC25A51-like n=1 Tax=Amphiura filiformis TaxID=82378 RepID=UPI003B21DA5B